MAFYKIAEMQKNRATANPQQFVQSAVGECMKAGIVTKPDEEGPPLHMHPNEEQFTLVLEGKLHFVLGHVALDDVPVGPLEFAVEVLLHVALREHAREVDAGQRQTPAPQGRRHRRDRRN